MKKTAKRVLALILVLLMITPLFSRFASVFGAGRKNAAIIDAITSGTTPAGSVGRDPLVTGNINLTGMDLDNAIHFIIRHWHMAKDPKGFESGTNEDGTPNYTVVIGGFIIPKDDGSYEYYARAYNGSVEAQKNADNNLYKGFARITKDTVSSYIKINEDGDIELPINPYHKNQDYYELFAGFSISSGQTAVRMEDGQQDEYSESAKLIIDHTAYNKVHLIKSHVYYTSQLMTVEGELEMGTKTGSAAPFPNYIDTEIYSDGTTDKNTKLYNTNKGLHTDKTAIITKNEAYNDGRTFDLDLETWFNDGEPVNIGMILDASGSMGFTLESPIPIKVLGEDNPLNLTEAQLEALSAKQLKSGDTSDFTYDDFLSNSELKNILNPRNTDKSSIRSSGYTYFIYDPRPGVVEFVPLGYWDGASHGAGYPIGLYMLNKDSTDKTLRERDYGLNSVTGDEDLKVVERTNKSSIDFTTVHNVPTTEGRLAWQSDGDLKFDANIGFNLTASKAALKLGVTPTSKNFTLSFTIKQNGSDSKPAEQAEILYIGPLVPGESDYIRMYRNSGGSANRLRVDSGSGNTLANINGVFGNTNSKYVTLVFENNTVTTYVYENGNTVDTSPVTNSFTLPDGDNYIIFNPFNNSYNGANIFVDDIYLFDNAISASDIPTLRNSTLSPDDLVDVNSANVLVQSTEGGTMGTATKANIANTAAERDGWYYINPTGNWSTNYANKSVQSGKTFNGIVKNIVFKDNISSSEEPTGVREKYGLEFGGTKKTFKSSAITPTLFYIDTKGYLRCFYYVNSNGGYGSSYVYENSDADYIKVEALQRAMGSFLTELEAKSPESMVSAVRFSAGQLPDSDLDMLVLLDWTADPVEAEKALSNQRGDGGTQRITGSKSSKGSKFSNYIGDSNGIEQFNYGLTGNTSTIKGIEAYEQVLHTRLEEYLKRKYTANNEKPGAKYIIIFTDGKDTDLNTLVGANATENEVLKAIYGSEVSGGTGNGLDAYVHAKNLREEGYTIFCVLLAGGPVSQSKDANGKEIYNEYSQAMTFLNALSGPGKGSKEEERDEEIRKHNAAHPDPKDQLPLTQYVYSTEGPVAEQVGGNKIDKLIGIFNEEGGIMTQLTSDLKNYCIQDYIDPRFDIVDANNYVWHLNANGSITVTDKNGEPVINTTLLSNEEKTAIVVTDGKGTPQITKNFKGKYEGMPIALTLSDSDITETALQAMLFYNGEKNLYYIKWTNQIIPGAPVATSRTPVWHSRITVRAKDDFLGGNAVMSNGNGADENYVFDPTDDNKSSGTDDMFLGLTETEDEKVEDNPSKGFPRTTVNVGSPNGNAEGEQLLYMGESLTKKDILNKLEEEIENKLKSWTFDDDARVKYYWEYLCRYAEKTGTTLEALLSKIEKDGKLEIPYSYIRNTDNSNQTGSEKHEADELGILVYTWQECADITTADGGTEKTPAYPNGASTDTKTRISMLTVEYKPKSANERVSDKDGTNWNEKLHSEGEDNNGELIYGWDRDFKKEAGTEQTGGEHKGKFTTKLVAGEIAVQMLIDDSAIQKAPGVKKIVYSADLYREYNGKQEFAGTYTATYIIENGKQSEVLAEFEPAGDFAKYVNAYGLPIGTYTLRQNAKTSTGADNLFFLELNAVVLTDENDGVFASDTNFTTENENSAYLKSATTSNLTANLGMPRGSKGYTDLLYALFQIELFATDEEIEYVPLPETGGSGALPFFSFGALFIFGALGFYALKKRRYTA
ncbi:MAG: LPXTG cell wall anchor domain-containing protein [Oscillospiraceae bacterium]|nr:LPXTG cell wall anchor domain-containing protein [Oscillospiraceae bacterium]